MSTELPRVWVGKLAKCPPFWLWYADCRQWVGHSLGCDFDMVRTGYLFVPGDQPKPTIDPAEMTELKTCKEIDW